MKLNDILGLHYPLGEEKPILIYDANGFEFLEELKSHTQHSKYGDKRLVCWNVEESTDHICFCVEIEEGVE